jgi:alkylation response protein AidB-like acyl-CoA dehydrogenase
MYVREPTIEKSLSMSPICMPMTSPSSRITSIDDPALVDLCRFLAQRADDLDQSGKWPVEQLAACAAAGVYEWFVPSGAGGQGWGESDLARAYVKLSAACLTTTFCVTQPVGAIRRLAASENEALRREWLPDVIAGRRYVTIGVSQLTTSRRHLSQAPLVAEEQSDGFRLDGYIPWVTGGDHADAIVIGAVLADGRQILLLMPTNLSGVRAGPPARLVGLSATHTGVVRCENVRISRDQLLAGPAENVMAAFGGGGTGGLQTSALAIGVATAAIEYLASQAESRSDLLGPLGGLFTERNSIEQDLVALAMGENPCTNQDLRTRANSLVLRATQAALAAAKGTGYVAGHPTGRWCREALFFLVWSCPQPVLAANLCELAGLA